MTIGQLKRWQRDNGIPDDWPVCVATFARSGTSLHEIEGVNVNSGGRSIQLEVYPDGWWPVSEGTTRFGDEGGGSDAAGHGGDLEEEIVRRACRAYLRGGEGRPVPSYGMSDVSWAADGTAAVILANVNGVLARYCYTKATDRLRRAARASSAAPAGSASTAVVLRRRPAGRRPSRPRPAARPGGDDIRSGA